MPLIQGSQTWYEDVIPMTDGIVTYYPPEISAKGAALDLDSFYEVKRELRKVPGRLRRATLPGGGAIRGLFFYHLHGAPEENVLIVHTTDRVFTTKDLNNFVQRQGSLSGGSRDIVSYTVVTIPTQKRVLWVDGIDSPKEMDPTTFSIVNLTLPVNVTNARIVRFFKSRTLLINVVEDGSAEASRIWSSSPITYNDWDSANGAGTNEYAEGGGHIVQAVEFNDAMVLFKESRIGAMQHTGDELFPFRIQDFPEVPGTHFPNSPVVTPRGILYLAYDGVRLFDGQRSILISGQVGFDIAGVAANQRDAVVGKWDLRLQRYLLAMPEPGGANNNLVWQFNFSTNEAQLLNQGQLYKKRQPISVFGEFTRDSPFTLEDLPVQLQQVPFELGDPILSGAYPVLLSGNFSGGLFEQELLTDDDGIPINAWVEFGPYPKDPMITVHVGKVLTWLRFRGRFTPGSSMTVKIRPVHEDVWRTLPSLIQVMKDRFTVKLDGAGIQGEQFFVRLEDSGQYSWSRVYSMTLFGTHTGAPWVS